MMDPADDYLPQHIYMSLWTDLSRECVARFFVSAGWFSRKCSWTDFEVRLKNKAILVVESQNPILVHGPIESAEDLVPRIRDVLDKAGIRYTFEAYNDRDEIVDALTENQ